MPLDAGLIDWHHVGSIHRPGQECVHTITRPPRSCLTRIFLSFGILLLGATSISGANAGQEALEQTLEAFTARQKMTTLLPQLKAGVAIEVQDLLLMNLAPDYGGVAGYLCELAADGRTVVVPVLENMFTSSGATLYGAKGSDQSAQLGWLLRVRAEGTVGVGAPPSLHEYFSELIPAVIVRDRLLRVEQQGQWAAMTAVNAGVRYLVLGAPWPIDEAGDAEILNGPMKAVLANRAGEILTEGLSLSENREPLNAVAALQELLAARGRALRAGDLVSLGSVGSAVVLGGIGRVTAHFSTVLGERRIVFAMRPPVSG